MHELPTPARRALALLFLILTLTGGWVFALRPLVNAARDAVEALADVRFERHRLALLTADDADTTPETLRVQRDTLQSELFSTHATEDVTPRFVAEIDQLLRASALRLNHLRTGPPSRTGSLVRFAADVQATGPEAAFVELLGSIERHRPILVVERLALVSPVAAKSEADAHVPPELTIELRLSGFGAALEAGLRREEHER